MEPFLTHILVRGEGVAARCIAHLLRREGFHVSTESIAQPLCGPDWILCGSAALAFDPICGDGTAQAVREAILAAAVIRGIAAGGDSAALLAYYQTRLLAGVQKHLALCHPYYETGGSGAWWQAEAASLTEGFRWCAAKLRNAPEPRYLLRGFDLTERDPLTIN